MNLDLIVGGAAILRSIGIDDGKAFMASCVARGLARRGPPALTDGQVEQLMREQKKAVCLARYHARRTACPCAQTIEKQNPAPGWVDPSTKAAACRREIVGYPAKPRSG